MVSHQDRFGLVAGVVAEQQIDHPGVAAGGEQGGVARVAGAGGEAGAGVKTGEGENSARNFVRRHERRDPACFGGGFRTEPVIDGEGKHRSAVGAAPIMREHGERQAVGTAGNRYRNPSAAPGPEFGQGGFELGG